MDRARKGRTSTVKGQRETVDQTQPRMTETDMNLNGIAELDDTTSPAGDPLEPCLKARTGFDGIVGKCADLRHVLRLVDTVARGGATVLLLGETRTGKELAAPA